MLDSTQIVTKTKVKPSHYMIRENGNWISWPFGELSVAALKKHELGKPKVIQGVAIFGLFGGLTANGTFWRWDCFKGFTSGAHANGKTDK